MTLLSALCESCVKLSASSRIMILNGGHGYFSLYSFDAGACINACCAKVLIRSRTTVIPLSSDALSSSTLEEKSSGPYNSLDSARIVLVFPVPGGPYIRRCGREALLSIRRRTSTTWSWDLTSSRVLGLYFSTHGCIRGAAGASWLGLDEPDPFSAANFDRALLSKNEAAMLWAPVVSRRKMLCKWLSVRRVVVSLKKCL